MDPESILKAVVPADIFTYPSNGSYLEKAQHLIEQCHPGATGMRLTKLTADEGEAEIPSTQSNRALHGFLHGGAYFTVGDTITAIMCMYHVEKESERMLTLSASIRYLRPIRNETVLAKARLKSVEGKTLYFVCDFINQQTGKRAAQSKYTYVLAEPG